MLPFSIPSKRPLSCVETKASSGNPSIIPRSVSLKSASLSSNKAGSFPISAICSSVKPALASCFFF
jgi:hypothetical protein